MKYSKQIILLLALCFSNLVFADESRVDAEYWSQKYAVVMSSSQSQRVPIYEDILASNENLELGFLDVLAETYLSVEGSGKHELKANTLLFEILATSSNNQRYLDVFKVGKRPVRQAKLNRKVDRMIRKAKKIETVEQYIAGSIDLDEIKKQYGQVAFDADVTFRDSELPLSGLSPNSTIQDMFNSLGVPQHMISGAQRYTNGIVSVNIKRLNYYYRGQGRVVFDYKKRKGWVLYSVILDPIGFEEVMPYREYSDSFNVMGDYDLHMAMLSSDGLVSIRRVAEIYNAANESTKIEMLDVAAEKLLIHFKDSEEPAFLDAYAWLCKWLAQRGGPRYKEVLGTVASNTENAKLVKYATSKIKEQKGIPVDLYRQGSVSLVAVMKKYPSPYSN